MKPEEHKTVQARILDYAEAIGWTLVPREEAEQRRGGDPSVPPADRAKNRSPFFDDLLDALANTGGVLLGWLVARFLPNLPQRLAALSARQR
ncbi:MAG: hypothetical protein ACYCZA_03535 [Thiobacillus sp.]